MIKEYKKRFVISTMLMVSMVLLAAFIALSVSAYRSEYNGLIGTMEQVLRPLEYTRGGFQTFNKRGPMGMPSFPGGGPMGQQGGPGSSQSDEPDTENSRRSRDTGLSDDNITTLLYDQSEDRITILTRDSDLDQEAIYAAVEAIADAEDKYGRISEYGLIYYKESGDMGLKIALADSAYLNTKIFSRLGGLSLAFIGIMALMLLMSMRMAKTAVKPLEEAIDMERQFVADISHDLKTPISVMMANNSVLRSSPDATISEQMQWIDSSDEAARNMRGLVEEMLTLSSLESQSRSAEAERTRVDLSSAAEKCVLQMESLAFERGVAIEEELEEGIHILAKPEFAERICSGLIENALKYESLGGSIKVKLYKDRKRAVFSVKNGGILISGDDLPHIFERFYRSDKARSEKKGFGLGLPIIKQLCEMSGAHISAESSEGEGTIFTVVFDTLD
ncbi:MAG: hypothetical protein IJM08_00710 [Firmicutes bacterium]|nr:hypothetical protein [Bacillota bacterium]